jgi:hypothetical protein
MLGRGSALRAHPRTPAPDLGEAVSGLFCPGGPNS